MVSGDSPKEEGRIQVNHGLLAQLRAEANKGKVASRETLLRQQSSVKTIDASGNVSSGYDRNGSPGHRAMDQAHRKLLQMPDVRQTVQAVPVPNPEEIENEYMNKVYPPQPRKEVKVAAMRSTIFDGVSGATNNVPAVPKDLPSLQTKLPARQRRSTNSTSGYSSGNYGGFSNSNSNSNMNSLKSMQSVPSRVDSGLGTHHRSTSDLPISRQSTPPQLIPFRAGQDSQGGFGSSNASGYNNFGGNAGGAYSNSGGYSRKASSNSVAAPIGDLNQGMNQDGATVTRAITRSLPSSYAKKHGPSAMAAFDRAAAQRSPVQTSTRTRTPSMQASSVSRARMEATPPSKQQLQNHKNTLRKVGMAVVSTKAELPSELPPASPRGIGQGSGALRRPVPIAKRMAVVAQPEWNSAVEKEKKAHRDDILRQQELRDQQLEDEYQQQMRLHEEHFAQREDSEARQQGRQQYQSDPNVKTIDASYPLQKPAKYFDDSDDSNIIDSPPQYDSPPKSTRVTGQNQHQDRDRTPRQPPSATRPAQPKSSGKPPKPPTNGVKAPSFGAGIKTGFSAFDRQKIANFLEEKTDELPMDFTFNNSGNSARNNGGNGNSARTNSLRGSGRKHEDDSSAEVSPVYQPSPVQNGNSAIPAPRNRRRALQQEQESPARIVAEKILVKIEQRLKFIVKLHDVRRFVLLKRFQIVSQVDEHLVRSSSSDVRFVFDSNGVGGGKMNEEDEIVKEAVFCHNCLLLHFKSVVKNVFVVKKSNVLLKIIDCKFRYRFARPSSGRKSKTSATSSARPRAVLVKLESRPKFRSQVLTFHRARPQSHPTSRHLLNDPLAQHLIIKSNHRSRGVRCPSGMQRQKK